MAKAKKSTFVDIELDWAEKQLRDWKKYIDSHPIHQMRDRFDDREKLVAKMEDQSKHIQELLKNYLTLLKDVDLMREKEDLKKDKPRGDVEETPFESGDI